MIYKMDPSPSLGWFDPGSFGVITGLAELSNPMKLQQPRPVALQDSRKLKRKRNVSASEGATVPLGGGGDHGWGITGGLVAAPPPNVSGLWWLTCTRTSYEAALPPTVAKRRPASKLPFLTRHISGLTRHISGLM